jgi:hypothetical protein
MACNSTNTDLPNLEDGWDLESFRSFGCSVGCWECRRMRRSSKHDAGFHFNWMAVLQVRFDLPLPEGISDGLCLAWKRAENVNMLYPASFVDDDPDGLNVRSLKTGSTRAITLSSRA